MENAPERRSCCGPGVSDEILGSLEREFRRALGEMVYEPDPPGMRGPPAAIAIETAVSDSSKANSVVTRFIDSPLWMDSVVAARYAGACSLSSACGTVAARPRDASRAAAAYASRSTRDRLARGCGGAGARTHFTFFTHKTPA
jgi:hypothetical protein